ncbi:low-density lipoprotein receptor, partial [Elysia marginata]
FSLLSTIQFSLLPSSECQGGSLVCSGEPCQVKCEDNGYLCNDGRCISQHFQCNGHPDCHDGADEFHCEGDICNGLRCDNDQCVGNDTLCDGKMDCLDSSDEDQCDMTCDAEEFRCSRSDLCIPKVFMCDGQTDCFYGEDEADCTECSDTEFHCNQTSCVGKQYRCDGHSDCADGSDEAGCNSLKYAYRFDSEFESVKIMTSGTVCSLVLEVCYTPLRTPETPETPGTPGTPSTPWTPSTPTPGVGGPTGTTPDLRTNPLLDCPHRLCGLAVKTLAQRSGGTDQLKSEAGVDATGYSYPYGGATLTVFVFTLNGNQDVDGVFPPKKQNYDLEIIVIGECVIHTDLIVIDLNKLVAFEVD